MVISAPTKAREMLMTGLASKKEMQSIVLKNAKSDGSGNKGRLVSQSKQMSHVMSTHFDRLEGAFNDSL